MVSSRADRIEQLLTQALAPIQIHVKDQSHLHAGHAGAADGRGHFDVFIVASGFDGKSRIQRHRLVHEVLGKMLQTDIHALSIHALTPLEAEKASPK